MPSRPSSPPIARVSAVIPNKDGAGLVGRCVEAVLTAGAFEVIVVDDGSCDRSPAEAEAAGAQLLRSPGTGFAAAVNAGAQAASGDVLLVLNSDCFVGPETVGCLATALAADPRIGICAASLVEEDGTPGKSHAPQLGVGLALKTLFDLNPVTVRRPGHGVADVECVPLACAALRRPVWDQLAGLDEQFVFYFEDQDLCRRLREAGLRVTIDWGAQSTHVGGASSIARDEQRWYVQFTRSRARYLRKHNRRTWPLFAAVWLPTALARSALWGLRRGPDARGWARTWLVASWAGVRG